MPLFWALIKISKALKFDDLSAFSFREISSITFKYQKKRQYRDQTQNHFFSGRLKSRTELIKNILVDYFWLIFALLIKFKISYQNEVELPISVTVFNSQLEFIHQQIIATPPDSELNIKLLAQEATKNVSIGSKPKSRKRLISFAQTNEDFNVKAGIRLDARLK